MRTLADIFKALSDETRLRMLALLLRRGELCVCDFVEALGITQSKASRHLRHLLHAGLVRDRRSGVWVYYQARADDLSEAFSVLEAVAPVLHGVDLTATERRLDAWMAAKQHRGCDTAGRTFEGGA